MNKPIKARLLPFIESETERNIVVYLRTMLVSTQRRELL